MIDLWSLDYEKYRLVKIESKYHISVQEIVLKYRLQIRGHFIEALICLRPFF